MRLPYAGNRAFCLPGTDIAAAPSLVAIVRFPSLLSSAALQSQAGRARLSYVRLPASARMFLTFIIPARTVNNKGREHSV